MEIYHKELIYHCTYIRSSILNVKDETRLFKEFPIGCCRDASILMGIFFSNIGLENLIYCRSTFDNGRKSHAWLEYKNFIIDITASQFCNAYDEIIVSPNINRSKIHKNPKFEPYKLEIAGFDAIQIIKDFDLIFKF
jgi:hypothetical protein